MKMKLKIIILLVLTMVIQSCKKDEIILKPNNELKTFNEVTEQIFDLDTLGFSEIKGEKGTLIYFNRNDFNVQKKSKVKVILKEYFNLKDLLYNNIKTVTNKNELLESSGVIYLEFQANEKKIDLKKGKYIILKFPKEKLKDKQIFYAEIDSLKQIKWKISETKITTITKKIRIRDLTLLKEYRFPSDSLNVYQDKWKKEFEVYQDSINKYGKKFEKIENYASTLISGDFSYINLDKIVKNVKKIDFEIELRNKSIDQISTYLLYKNRMSFISFYKTIDNLKFESIPFIKGETSILTIGMKDGVLLANVTNLKENITGKLKIKLKKYSKEEIEILLKR